MLSALKWVYQLGVKRERERIAHALKENRFRAMTNFKNGIERVRNDDEMKDHERRELELETAVNGRVGDLIETILRPEARVHDGNSIMYPEEEK